VVGSLTSKLRVRFGEDVVLADVPALYLSDAYKPPGAAWERFFAASSPLVKKSARRRAACFRRRSRFTSPDSVSGCASPCVERKALGVRLRRRAGPAPQAAVPLPRRRVGSPGTKIKGSWNRWLERNVAFRSVVRRGLATVTPI
jgi:hypothetical protein